MMHALRLSYSSNVISYEITTLSYNQEHKTLYKRILLTSKSMDKTTNKLLFIRLTLKSK